MLCLRAPHRLGVGPGGRREVASHVRRGGGLKAGQAWQVRARASQGGGACATGPLSLPRLRVLGLEAEQLLGLVHRHKEGRVAEGEEALAETKGSHAPSVTPPPSS